MNSSINKTNKSHAIPLLYSNTSKEYLYSNQGNKMSYEQQNYSSYQASNISRLKINTTKSRSKPKIIAYNKNFYMNKLENSLSNLQSYNNRQSFDSKLISIKSGSSPKKNIVYRGPHKVNFNLQNKNLTKPIEGIFNNRCIIYFCIFDLKKKLFDRIEPIENKLGKMKNTANDYTERLKSSKFRLNSYLSGHKRFSIGKFNSLEALYLVRNI